MPLNDTHDPNLKSWVESANDPATDFPIQNLPLVHATPKDTRLRPSTRRLRGGFGLVIGEEFVDLLRLCEASFVHGEEGGEDIRAIADAPTGIGPIMDSRTISVLRKHVSRLLGTGATKGMRAALQSEQVVYPIKGFDLAWPTPGHYTDFYASIHHATTVGSMFRPDNPLLPNYKHIPIGYHGRASSIVPSGTPIRRPRGQTKADDAPGAPPTPPTFGPCAMLDYELEIGAIIGPGNTLGEPISIRDAEKHIFGLCLVNDWSARDLQKWEYQPLGPFLAKNFATTISPYIVTLEALEPFRAPAARRDADDPQPLDYLRDETDQARGGFDITLEVHLRSAEMEKRGLSPVLLSRSRSFKDMYWTFAQMLTHHTSNGCNMQPGDLIASGTVSGPEPSTRGCLLELTWQGRGPDGKPLPRKPIELPSGEKRLFLADGDEVIIKGYCERDGFRRIGFGECRGRITPSPA